MGKWDAGLIEGKWDGKIKLLGLLKKCFCSMLMSMRNHRCSVACEFCRQTHLRIATYHMFYPPVEIYNEQKILVVKRISR